MTLALAIIGSLLAGIGIGYAAARVKVAHGERQEDVLRDDLRFQLAPTIQHTIEEDIRRWEGTL